MTRSYAIIRSWAISFSSCRKSMILHDWKHISWWMSNSSWAKSYIDLKLASQNTPPDGSAWARLGFALWWIFPGPAALLSLHFRFLEPPRALSIAVTSWLLGVRQKVRYLGLSTRSVDSISDVFMTVRIAWRAHDAPTQKNHTFQKFRKFSDSIRWILFPTPFFQKRWKPQKVIRPNSPNTEQFCLTPKNKKVR